MAKFIGVLVTFILTFFIPNSFFRAYGWIALVISYFFLVFQGLMIIGFSYTLNGKLIGASENSNGPVYLMLVLSIFFALICLLFTILKFVWFAECWANNIIILVPLGM